MYRNIISWKSNVRVEQIKKNAYKATSVSLNLQMISCDKKKALNCSGNYYVFI